jgi:hypothetical protein
VEVTQGNKTLIKLIDDVTGALEELAAWPDSEVTRSEADRAVKLLKKAWKDESYPRAFLFIAMLHIGHNIHGGTANRTSVTDAGLRAAWTKLGDLI